MAKRSSAKRQFVNQRTKHLSKLGTSAHKWGAFNLFEGFCKGDGTHWLTSTSDRSVMDIVGQTFDKEDTQTLQAAIAFLEGSRLSTSDESLEEGIGHLKFANSLAPKNIAISYALAMSLKKAKDLKSSIPYFKLVAEKGTGVIQRVSQQWCSRLSKVHFKRT